MPRASWKGFLRLSLVSCPIYLSPATTRTKSIRLHQVWQPTAARSVATEDEEEEEQPSQPARRSFAADMGSESRTLPPPPASPFARTTRTPAKRSSARRSSKGTNMSAASL